MSKEKEILYDKILEKIPNKYELAIICGVRYREFMEGAETLSKTAKAKDTHVRKVFLEILEGKIGVN